MMPLLYDCTDCSSWTCKEKSLLEKYMANAFSMTRKISLFVFLYMYLINFQFCICTFREYYITSNTFFQSQSTTDPAVLADSKHFRWGRQLPAFLCTFPIIVPLYWLFAPVLCFVGNHCSCYLRSLVPWIFCKVLICSQFTPSCSSCTLLTWFILDYCFGLWPCLNFAFDASVCQVFLLLPVFDLVFCPLDFACLLALIRLFLLPVCLHDRGHKYVTIVLRSSMLQFSHSPHIRNNKMGPCDTTALTLTFPDNKPSKTFPWGLLLK